MSAQNPPLLSRGSANRSRRQAATALTALTGSLLLTGTLATATPALAESPRPAARPTDMPKTFLPGLHGPISAPILPAATQAFLPGSRRPIFAPLPIAAPAPTAAPAPVATPVSETPDRVTIDGSAVRMTHLNSRFAITGTAPAGALVTLHFHQAGTAPSDYSIVRTTVADSMGNWSDVLVTNVDHRYFAKVGGATSSVVLNQLEVATVDGARARITSAGHTYILTGTASPGSTVWLHFHRFGMAAGDFSIVRSVVADADGNWTRSYLAEADYRLYASNAATPHAAAQPTLIQARA